MSIATSIRETLREQAGVRRAHRRQSWRSLFQILNSNDAARAGEAIDLAKSLEMDAGLLSQTVETVERWQALSVAAARLPEATARRAEAREQAEKYRMVARAEIDAIVCEQRALVVELGAGRIDPETFQKRRDVLDAQKAELNEQLRTHAARIAEVGLAAAPFQDALAELRKLEVASPWLTGADPAWL